jgi:hypothetical protein
MLFAHFESVFDEQPRAMSALTISIHCSSHLITELNIEASAFDVHDRSKT